MANSVRRSGPPKQQFVVRPSPSIGQEVDHRAVGIDDADAVFAGGRNVRAAVDVVAEPVATTVAERLDHPLARAVGVHGLQPAPFHDDDDTVGRERDAVAVLEVAGRTC